MYTPRILAALVLAGCSNPQHPQPATCEPSNPYFCGVLQGRNSCCDEAEPRCWGPDDKGYYCEPPSGDPSDPGFAKRKRHYAHTTVR